MSILVTLVGFLARYMLPIAILLALGAGYVGNTLLQALTAPREIKATVTLESIQALSELSTVRYNFSSIVTTERDMPGLLAGLYGERQAMVAVGHVRAGVDLGQMTEEDIIRGEDVLVITLPPPNLQDCFLNENQSYIVFRETGLFSRNAPDLDSSARSYAVQQFRAAALEANILDEVNHQTQLVIEEFIGLLELGETQVRVLVSEPDSDNPLPDTCL